MRSHRSPRPSGPDQNVPERSRAATQYNNARVHTRVTLVRAHATTSLNATSINLGDFIAKKRTVLG